MPITAKGLDDLIASLEKESTETQKEADKAVGSTAKAVRSTAREIAPKGGDPRGRGPNRPPLAGSIEATRKGLAIWEIGPTALQGRFMEYGTYKDAPQPFMGPATDQHEGQLVEDLEGLVGEL